MAKGNSPIKTWPGATGTREAPPAELWGGQASLFSATLLELLDPPPHSPWRSKGCKMLTAL